MYYEAFDTERLELVDHLRNEGIKDLHVLRIIQKIPRHLFIPHQYLAQAYHDIPLPIGYNQTTLQPYIIARMTEALQLDGCAKVLEIGTGSGYQTAVLAEICHDIFSIEIISALAENAKKILTLLGYCNIRIKNADGHWGWIAHAPYDAIIVTASTATVPHNVLEQLKIGGHMIIPLQDAHGAQRLEKIKKTSSSSYSTEKLLNMPSSSSLKYATV